MFVCQSLGTGESIDSCLLETKGGNAKKEGKRNIYFHGNLFSSQFTLDPILVKQYKEITDFEMVLCPFCSVY